MSGGRGGGLRAKAFRCSIAFPLTLLACAYLLQRMGVHVLNFRKQGTKFFARRIRIHNIVQFCKHRRSRLFAMIPKLNVTGFCFAVNNC